MQLSHPLDCIVLAAGKGVRMRNSVPKQFMRLAGKPLIIHVLEILEQLNEIGSIWVTYLSGYETTYLQLFEQYGLRKPKLVQGGATRQWSVYNALQCVSSDRVVIHEAVRPFFSVDLLRSMLALDAPAVVPTVPVPFTVSVGDMWMTGELNRSTLHNIQLPQVFDTKVLREAHERFYMPGDATEDSLLVFRLGKPVRFVPGLEYNIKITTPLDLELAELIYREG